MADATLPQRRNTRRARTEFTPAENVGEVANISYGPIKSNGEKN